MTAIASAPASINIEVTISVSEESIADLLCGALEGGSKYWCNIKSFVKPRKLRFRTSKTSVYEHLDYPMNTGGAVVLEDFEADKKTTHRLDRKSISKGLKAMAEKHPRQFANFQSGNFDGITSDVFLQCCLFGDTIYA